MEPKLLSRELTSMSIVDQFFGSFCSRRFSVPDIKAPAKGVSDSFHAIYDTFNGGLFWDGALLIRPLWAVGDAPLAIADWNQEILWKGRYGSTCRDITFFAEDTFGCQFGLSSDGIVHFDPEIGTAKVISTTFEGWCGELCRDPEFYTGYPVLAAWERKHGKLAAKSRLIPKLFFVFGGEYESDNMICKPDLTCMLIRAELWEMIRDVPDGASIRLQVID